MNIQLHFLVRDARRQAARKQVSSLSFVDGIMWNKIDNLGANVENTTFIAIFVHLEYTIIQC